MPPVKQNKKTSSHKRIITFYKKNKDKNLALKKLLESLEKEFQQKKNDGNP